MKIKSVVKSYMDSLLMIIGMVIGAIVGIIWGEGASVLTNIADVFLNLLFCIVVPLVFISIVNSIAGLGSGKTVGKLMLVMFSVFIITEILSAVISLGIIGAINPGAGATLPSTTEAVESEAVSFNILAQLTVSDFNLLWSRSSLLAIVVFAVLSGLGLRAAGEKAASLRELVAGLSETIVKMVGYIMKLAPIGLGCYFASMVGQFGQQISGPMLRVTVVCWIFAPIYLLISQTLFSFLGDGITGIKRFWKNMISPALTALGTCSSAASVPANIQAGKKAGLSDDVNAVCMPMGCNLHKEGACLIVVLTMAYIGPMVGMNLLDPKTFLMIVACCIIGATVTGAIPSGGNVIVMLTVAMFNFPTATIPLIIMLHTLCDAPTTMLNVVGDLSSGIIIDKFMHGQKQAQ